MNHNRSQLNHYSRPDRLEPFNPEIAFEILRKRYIQLSDTFIEYLEEASIDRKERNAKAQIKKEKLVRIFGGIETIRFPQTCLIGTLRHAGTIPIPNWYCTGVLIHERCVLTAAHCISPNQQYVVAVNATNRNDLNSPVEISPVKKISVKLDYYQTQRYHNIAALILRDPVSIEPIPLATIDEISSVEQATLVGFGNSSPNSATGFGVKREVDIPIMSVKSDMGTDLSEDEFTYGFEADLEFVAGGEGFDPCNQDTGGPALIKVKGQYKLAGLISRPTLNSNSNYGGGSVFTRIDQQKAWVNSVLDFGFI